MEFASKVFFFDELDRGIFVYVRLVIIVPCQCNSDLITTSDIGRGKRDEPDADPGQILNEYSAPVLVLGKFGIISLNISILALGSSGFKENLKRRSASTLHFQLPRMP